VHALWLTHAHADHVHGIDDLRVFTGHGRPSLPAYVPEEYLAELHGRFPYIFDASIRVPEGTTKPEIGLIPLRRGQPVEILGATFQPLAVPHGDVPVYGFRVGGLGYVTDGKLLPPDVLEALQGVDVMVINALWYGSPHPTHFNVEEAVEAARAVGARRTYLIHMTHRLLHAELLERLPERIEPAYDGLTVEI
jgi:phosphoribosyl 1,2-cyclic phosphate phosphodiesterase